MFLRKKYEYRFDFEHISKLRCNKARTREWESPSDEIMAREERKDNEINKE